jgi:riboflavin synthase
MFTGLVEGVGEVVERKPTSGGFRLRIAAALTPARAPGDSLAVNGVCLTVILAEHDEIHADIGPETARVTTLGSVERGAVVNLERPLRADGRLGGHFVQGHIDAVGYVEEIRQDAEFHWLTVSFPRHLAPYIVDVPYTMEHTNLGRIGVRERVNLECDMVGKYVVRAAELAGLTLNNVRPGEVTH